MDWIKDLEENKEIIINDFKAWLEEKGLSNINLSLNGDFNFCTELLVEQYINDYISSLYYDIQDNTDNYAEHLNVENKIFEILKNYFENT